MRRTFFKDLEQGTPAWYDARAGLVTASAMRSLVTGGGQIADNDTSRGLIRTLAAERIIGKPAETFSSRMMDRGSALEIFARDIYHENIAPVDEVGFIRADMSDYSLGFSPDGVVEHDGLIEIKSPGAKEHLRTMIADEVPAVYQWQVQVGLFVTGRSWLDFVSYCPGMDLYVKRVYPDLPAHDVIDAAVQMAEYKIRYIIDTYTEASKNRIHTEWHDPFAEEEMEF